MEFDYIKDDVLFIGPSARVDAVGSKTNIIHLFLTFSPICLSMYINIIFSYLAMDMCN